MDFDEEDQSKRRFPKIPKFYPDKEMSEKGKEVLKDEEKAVKIKFLPVPITVIKKNQDASSEEYESDDDASDDEEKKNLGSNLDKWDKGARAWLSSGTMFFLIILFHLIQIRNDLRNFTSTANNQLESACSVLEDKTVGFQSALDLAAQDVGPITFKFVRDLKTKVKAAFHFAGQIFGGKVREVFMTIFQEYYCLLVGILVAYKSLEGKVLKAFMKLLKTENFLQDITELISKVIDEIVDIMTEPEKHFSDLFEKILDKVFDKTMTAVVIPAITGNNSMGEVCESVKKIDFSEIDRLIKGYMAKIITVIAVILVLYNYFKFIVTIESEEDDISDLEDDDVDEGDKKSKQNRIRLIPLSSLWNCLNWLKNFLNYQPFWIFLFMGIFGYLHLNFSESLKAKAEELKANIIEPAIEEIKNDFTTKLTNYLIDLELSWRNSFLKLMEPFTNFINDLSIYFNDAFKFVVNAGKKVMDFIEKILKWIDKISINQVGVKAVSAILDCFVLRNIKKWTKIVDVINTHLFGGQWNNLNGGIILILQKSITEIFRKLQITKHLKTFFSIHFMMFLNLVAKRSIFLYVYLIVCAILLCQGVLMMFIKFLLGYF